MYFKNQKKLMHLDSAVHSIFLKSFKIIKYIRQTLENVFNVY